MEQGLRDFAVEFKDHVEGVAAARNEANSVTTFTDVIYGYIYEAGEIGPIELCEYKRTGIQLNGYSIHDDGAHKGIDLVVSLQTRIVPPISIHKTEWEPVIKRCLNFLKKSLSGLHHALKKGTDEYEIAKKINDEKEEIDIIRIYFFTDGITKTINLEDLDVDGIQVTFHVWDLERLYRLKSSDKKREPVTIDLFEKYETSLPCLQMPSANDDYESYLLIVPGELLAMIYEEYGERLIERNVRSFLQVRGVNREIRKTILREPHMFLAYNNGLSATAEHVEFMSVNEDKESRSIKVIKDFQVVNGGQTTASIYHAFKKDKADISKVFVQMKLTVIKESEKMDEMVPIISMCANNQNKIQTADFYSNNPYHRKLEALSRDLWAPATDGSYRQSKWFYERARGQYLDMKGKAGTNAKKKLFDENYPKEQLFTKTDLAKFLHSWDQLPHVVSRGNQKNFEAFSKSLDDIELENIDKNYFYNTIAKAIIFNTINKLVTTKYRANIVTYTMAWLSYKMLEETDLLNIWQKQAVPSSMIDTMEIVIKAAYAHITTPPNQENITEWCKKEECWTGFRDMGIETLLAL
ncbi:AIPR family protein [Paenibacillus sacheonensis]|uniref:Abortive phage infection protein n=1 Tax=Paenibacillus sacheonensis TaxID=742054 RepID=A0A7X5BZP8_9BACL|nr:AIPR family protein [Paenibacillus sacheonensis]MBM7568083.1 hypothetical protein [Paenibacillus sacheonensis]NBC72888.1 abortive phage infection protein [Paenibacillus sacheonensis]